MKKKLNGILLIGVLGLWGTVIYRYVSHFFQDKPVQIDFQTNSYAKLPNKIEKDTFSLKNFAIDPFLKSVNIPKIENPKLELNVIKLPKPKKTEMQTVKTPKVIEETPFPDVKFYGYIKSQDKTDELILIRINNRLFKTRLNADCNGVLIKRIYRDSLEVKHEKRKLIVVKQR
ncbi:hypothetical protein [Flavobacterium columnare]|uniref:hypothetical protein n=1 Tax=Flavobacterium columnare TaxID=996 RepID=UPI0040334479